MAVRVDWERDWPIAAAVGLAVVGAVWASRARTEMVQRAVVLQPQPVDVSAIVQAQVAAQQARLETGAALATQYVQGIVALEQSKLAADVQKAQVAAMLEAARIEAETQRVTAELQAQAAMAQAATMLEAARIEAETQRRIAEMQAEAAKAQAEAQARAAQAQANAQQQAAFWAGLFGFLPFLFGLFSRERTLVEASRRAPRGGLAAQLRATRQLLEAVA